MIKPKLGRNGFAKMRLTELNPELITSPDTGLKYLNFKCPRCLDKVDAYGFIHLFSIPVSPEDTSHWDLTGNFETATLRPSILDTTQPNGCHVHFYITNGEIEIS